MKWPWQKAVVEFGPPSRGMHTRVNPKCEVWIGTWDDSERCGKPATERVNYMPYWSLYWCPPHAQWFRENLTPPAQAAAELYAYLASLEAEE